MSNINFRNEAGFPQEVSDATKCRRYDGVVMLMTGTNRSIESIVQEGDPVDGRTPRGEEPCTRVAAIEIFSDTDTDTSIPIPILSDTDTRIPIPIPILPGIGKIPIPISILFWCKK